MRFWNNNAHVFLDHIRLWKGLLRIPSTAWWLGKKRVLPPLYGWGNWDPTSPHLRIHMHKDPPAETLSIPPIKSSQSLLVKGTGSGCEEDIQDSLDPNQREARTEKPLGKHRSPMMAPRVHRQVGSRDNFITYREDSGEAHHPHPPLWLAIYTAPWCNYYVQGSGKVKVHLNGSPSGQRIHQHHSALLHFIGSLQSP